MCEGVGDMTEGVSHSVSNDPFLSEHMWSFPFD